MSFIVTQPKLSTNIHVTMTKKKQLHASIGEKINFSVTVDSYNKFIGFTSYEVAVTIFHHNPRC